jgi:MoaA/NifB/PqqE/SkfB family radical SAM enzyme
MYEFSEFKIYNHMDRIRQVIAGEYPPPVTFEIDPTNACNHDCVWCVDADHREAHKGHIKKETLFRVIDDAAAFGVRSIVLKGGGEPLLYPWIEELLERIHAAGLPVGIITNGEFILKNYDVIRRTCRWLRVSVDAGSAETHATVHKPKDPIGAYTRIWEGIAAIAPHIFTGIIYVIHPSTYHEMVVAANRAKEHGARYIAFKRVIAPDEVFAPADYAAIEANYQRSRLLDDEGFRVFGWEVYNFDEGPNKKPYPICKGHHLVAILCANGQMYACCSTRGDHRFSFGSIYGATLPELWLSDRRKRILAHIDTRACANICVGHTSYMRYDHYNKLFEYMMKSDRPHGEFL